jgi:lysophospholipase L1-like esterase
VVVPVALTSGAALRLLWLWKGIGRARALAAAGQAFERRVASTGWRVLVLGDSTGVGIGAGRPEESIAGLFAADHPDADIVNVSRSGARVAGALEQARECRRLGLRFDLALLHIGGNDVLRATPLDRLVEDSRLLMAELTAIAQHTLWLGPGDVGIAPLFPAPFSWLMRARTRAAAAVFSACATEAGVEFIDFSSGEHASRFSRERRRHFAVDKLHPSSSSYSYGYETIRRALRDRDRRGLAAEAPARGGPAHCHG